jgi:hypothetical protein
MNKTVLQAALDDAFRLQFNNLFRVLMVEKNDAAFDRFVKGLASAIQMYDRIEKVIKEWKE